MYILTCSNNAEKNILKHRPNESHENENTKKVMCGVTEMCDGIELRMNIFEEV